MRSSARRARISTRSIQTASRHPIYNPWLHSPPHPAVSAAPVCPRRSQSWTEESALCTRSRKLLDSITFGPAHTDTTYAREPAPCPAADALLPVTAPDNSWRWLGARPKALVSSTTSHQERWSLVSARGRRRRHFSHAPPHFSHAPPHYNRQLENKYDILDQHDFTPLAAKSLPPSPLPLSSRGSHSSLSPPITPPPIPQHYSRLRSRRSTPIFTPAPRRASAHLTVRPSLSTPSPWVKSSPPSTPPSTILIIGDSIVRNVKRNSN